MSSIQVEDISLLGATSLLAGYQMARFAIAVGAQRRKHKVDPPSVTGPDEFVRAVRAQQNSLEFFGIFMVTLWLTGLFFNQAAASVGGLVYMYGRENYFNGYIQEAKARLPGFYLSIKALKAMLGMAGIGIAHAILRQYFGINLKGFVGL